MVHAQTCWDSVAISVRNGLFFEVAFKVFLLSWKRTGAGRVREKRRAYNRRSTGEGSRHAEVSGTLPVPPLASFQRSWISFCQEIAQMPAQWRDFFHLAAAVWTSPVFAEKPTTLSSLEFISTSSQKRASSLNIVERNAFSSNAFHGEIPFRAGLVPWSRDRYPWICPLRAI